MNTSKDDHICDNIFFVIVIVLLQINCMKYFFRNTVKNKCFSKILYSLSFLHRVCITHYKYIWMGIKTWKMS